MEYDEEFFTFMRFNPETNKHESIHLLDIVTSVNDGSYENYRIIWPDYVLSETQYKKYGFLLHCIDIRRKEMIRQNEKINTDWEDLLNELANDPLT